MPIISVVDALFTRISLILGSGGLEQGKPGGAVSRNEGKIGGEGEAVVDAAEILAALARDAGTGTRRRQDAVRRYFSASDGWREASSVLGGAFATGEDGSRDSKG